jgi:dihydrofolate synthase/folylpolyglutamate synthase
VPVVLAPQKEEARQVVARVALERHAPLVEVGRAYEYAPGPHSLDGQRLRAWKAGSLGPEQVVELAIPLLGAHQVDNAAVAYSALQVAAAHGLRAGTQAIQRGFAGVTWPGRFEIVSRHPIVVIDSAHNRDSALKLRQALDDYFPGQPVILIIGASEDKDIEGMFAELMPRVSQVIATQAVHPRAAEPAALVELAQRYGRAAQAVTPVSAALEEALRLGGEETPVLAAGSLFMAGEVRTAWQTLLFQR